MKKRGQIAVEYMLVLALGLFLLISGVYVFFSYANSSTSTIAYDQVQSVGNGLLLAASEVSGLGDQSWTTLKARIPDEVKNISIVDSGSGTRELIFHMDTATSSADTVLFTTLPIMGGTPVDASTSALWSNDFVPGNAEFKILAQGSQINITRVR